MATFGKNQVVVMFTLTHRIARNFTAMCAASCLAVIANAQVAPKAPPTICIGSNCATAVKSSVNGIKFNPGTYVWYMPGAVNGVAGYRVDLPTQRNQLLAFIDSIATEPAIRGIQLAVYWRTLEGDKAGDYSEGFAAIDTILAKLARYGKQLSLNIFTAHFGNIASIYHVYPAYLVDGSNYGITNFHSPQVGGASRLWQQATMDRLLALSAAYATRYNSNANFEMIGGGETSLAIDQGTDGYTTAALLAQLQRFLVVARQQWPNTGLRLAANDMSGDSNLVALYATAAQKQATIGGPDIWPGDITQADRIFVGRNGAGAVAYTDYRGVIPWMAEVQWQSFSGQWTLQQLYDAPVKGYKPTNGDFTMPSMQPSYFVWYVNEVNGNASTQWTTGILPFIRSVNGAVSSYSCPRSYATGCSTQ
jgi:hypothetical protein